MPTISSFYGIIISMYWSDHAPPHFHAMYAGYEAAITLQSGLLLEGYLPPRALRMVRQWALANRAALEEDWRLCRDNKQPEKIPPLA